MNVESFSKLLNLHVKSQKKTQWGDSIMLKKNKLLLFFFHHIFWERNFVPVTSDK